MNSQFHPPVMSDRDFNKLSVFVYNECGIKLTPAKKIMLTGRLLKRMRVLGISSFTRYYEYISGSKGRAEELTQMINAVSTNKTAFFRESGHFDFMSQKILPEITRPVRGSPIKILNVWSAGCSSGEEPYTLAMIMADFLSKRPEFDFSILATDISTRMLAVAKRAIYSNNDIKPIPAKLRQKYLLRGTGSQRSFFRIVPELRNRIKFQQLNLTDRSFGIRIPIHILFCRNVIIYFDRKTQIELFKKFYNQLIPGGYLFIGHSETLYGINGQFHQVATTIYRRP